MRAYSMGAVKQLWYDLHQRCIKWTHKKLQHGMPHLSAFFYFCLVSFIYKRNLIATIKSVVKEPKEWRLCKFTYVDEPHSDKFEYESFFHMGKKQHEIINSWTKSSQFSLIIDSFKGVIQKDEISYGFVTFDKIRLWTWGLSSWNSKYRRNCLNHISHYINIKWNSRYHEILYRLYSPFSSCGHSNALLHKSKQSGGIDTLKMVAEVSFNCSFVILIETMK